MKANTIFKFIVAFLLFVGALYVSFFVQNNISKKIQSVQSTYLNQKQSENVDFGNKTKKNLESLSFKEEIIKSAFLQSNNMIGFITKLESTAEDFGVEMVVQKVSYGETQVLEQKYTIRPVTFNLEIKGGFEKIEFFIKRISNFGESLSIKELKISKNGGEEINSYTAHIIIESTTITYE